MREISKRPIWIIEDDGDIREALADVLRAEGYRTLEAANGREALERLRDEPSPPSLIILDLMMPVMDGFEFRHAQLADPRLSGIPIVVLTAGRHESKGTELGAAAYVMKPPDLDALLDTVRRHCL